MDENEKKEIDLKSTEELTATHEIYDWVSCVATALVLCVLLFCFFARVIDVKGQSMENTFFDGHKVVITRLAGKYRQGDIVVLQKNTYSDYPIIKRVIATEGQTIDIDFESGLVYIDGEVYDEPYVKELTYNREDFSGPVTVPEGCIWVMGDNRNHSQDSRYAYIGCVDTRCVLGKVILRIWPINKFGTVS